MTIVSRLSDVDIGQHSNAKRYQGPTLLSEDNRLSNRYSIEKKDSVGHKWPPRGAPGDFGGYFSIQRNSLKSLDWQGSIIRTGFFTDVFSGRVSAWQTVYTPSVYLTLNNSSQMNASGSTGWARAKPTKPQAGLSVFLGELREIPRIPDIRRLYNKSRYFFKHRSHFKNGSWSREAGSEYLNLVFGWIPFLSDLRKLHYQIVHFDERYKQLMRDSGKRVRRGSTVLDNKTTTVSTVSSNWAGVGAANTLSLTTGGLLTKTETTSERIWFKGSFTYYINKGHSVLDNAVRKSQLASAIFGAELTPSTIWALTPWSWLFDWVTNAGDVISNLSDSAFGLVASYAYVMRHRKIETTYVAKGIRTLGSNPTSFSVSQTYVNEVKQRSPATPYGFGLDPLSFSAKQVAILAALGLSRSR